MSSQTSFHWIAVIESTCCVVRAALRRAHPRLVDYYYAINRKMLRSAPLQGSNTRLLRRFAASRRHAVLLCDRREPVHSPIRSIARASEHLRQEGQGVYGAGQKGEVMSFESQSEEFKRALAESAW
ncbi:MAG: hypothetical protein WHS90_20705, partial [Caldilinea sp.]|uniref:hypothetical protein n=1 Tax=Caldilinea sp. TaxID=2293560 RepID=UPI0030A384F3